VSQLSFNPVGGYWAVAAVAVALFVLLGLIGPASQRTSPRQRMILRGLRGLSILLLLIAMLRPALVVTQVKRETASLILLLDSSRSMLVTDAFGGKSRWQSLVSHLEDAATELHKLATHLQIKIYTFNAELQAVPFDRQSTATDLELGGDPQGRQTAIGWALEEVVRRESVGRLAGVVLLSDGAQRAYAPRDTPAPSAARRLADLGCPIYSFTFGQARGLGQARDLALKDLITNQTVYVKNQLDVRGTLRVDGFAGKPLTVQLLFETASGKMEVVAATKVAASEDGQQLPVALSYVPTQAGEHKLTLAVVAQEGELVTTNNRLSTFVTVLKGGINVLYLEGQLRREQKFLRRALDASPNVKLDFWFDRQPRDKWPTAIGDRFAPDKYDVIIIGDLDSDALAKSFWQALADRVEQGAGLMMLGGFHSFGPGGYQLTPLADVLPVAMGRLERQGFGEPISKDLQLPGPLKMRPTTRYGAKLPALQLAPAAENMQTWNELPALDGGNRFRGLKANALILAESDGPNPAALLVAGRWGGGRVLAFAGDSTWHWTMEGFSQQHRRFWRQLVLWLAKKDESTEGNVWIRLAPRRYRPGSRVEFTVGANTPAGDRVEGATFQAEVTRPDGSRHPINLSARGPELLGTLLDTTSAGDYTLEVTATEGPQSLGTARARLLVFEQDLELDNPAADPGLLSSLARITAKYGGTALAPEEFPSLLERLNNTPLELETEIETRRDYWDTWPFLLLFVGLLCGEWFLRKRWQLV
jgi:uncharacterized membrane protein